MNLRNSRRPRAAVLAATFAVTAVLAVTAGCDSDGKDCKKRDKGAPTRTTSGENPSGDDARLAAFSKSSGGTSGARGGTTSGGSKGGTTKGGVTAGNSNHDDCEDED